MKQEKGLDASCIQTLTTLPSDICLPFRLINKGSSVVRRLSAFSRNGRRLEALMASAMKKTGLSDFGQEDFTEGLGHLLWSASHDRSLTLVERVIFESRVMIHLKNRLWIQKEITDHPDILNEQIEKPLFIVGLQRTGTTFLQTLLSLDPANRVLRDWESNPVEPDNDMRIHQARFKHRLFKMLSPNLPMIHPGSATDPLECLPLLMNAFVFNTVPGFCEFKHYVAFARSRRPFDSYRYYKLQLQILQYRRPKFRWVLKAPMHLEHLGVLADVFPDARIIQTHRSPSESIPSGCSLYASYLNMFRAYPDFKTLGRDYVDMWAYALFQGLAARKKIPCEQIMDIDYTRLARNPADTVKEIYAHFHMKSPHGMDQSIDGLLAEKRQNLHRYSLEQFYLTPRMIQQRFGNYIDRFHFLEKN